MKITLATIAALLAFSAWAAGPHFKTPETALAYYIESSNAKSLEGINEAFIKPVKGFNFSKPAPVERFRIVKRITYTNKEVNDWNRKGIIPPAAIGDVELHVEETSAGRTGMYSYNLRETQSGWRIVNFVSWDDK
jgi:hypothetical protein